MKIIGYKLIQDLPDTPKGTISHKIINGQVYFKSELILSDFSDSNIFTVDFCAKKTDWFEPVCESPQIPKGSDAESFVEFINKKEAMEIKRECSTLVVNIINKKIEFYFDIDTGKYLNIKTYIF